MNIFYGICAGLVFGLAAYLTIESKAPSYLSTDSKACANCHVMLSAYNTWEQSSHRENAKCVDCHIPHNNVVNKYVVHKGQFTQSRIRTLNINLDWFKTVRAFTLGQKLNHKRNYMFTAAIFTGIFLYTKNVVV